MIHLLKYFLVVWACSALYWLIATFFFRGNEYNLWDPTWTIVKTVLASIILDIVLAGSEIFHKIRLHTKKEIKTDDQVEPSPFCEELSFIT